MISQAHVDGASYTMPEQQQDSETISESVILKTCSDCERQNLQVWNCTYCADLNFCDSCWDRQPAHRKGRTGPEGFTHEKGDPDVVKRIKIY